MHISKLPNFLMGLHKINLSIKSKNSPACQLFYWFDLDNDKSICRQNGVFPDMSASKFRLSFGIISNLS